MAPTTMKPPTTELGAQSNTQILPGWSQISTFIDETEYVPELKWPRSTEVFDRMRNDSQVDALLSAVGLPIRRRKWLLDPNGARDEIVRGISTDLGLPVKGQDAGNRRRLAGRFSWKRHLEHVLLALPYGFYWFEQYGKIEDDGLWHLRKLAPRPPFTIAELVPDTDGNLVGIKQNIGARTFMPQLIPIDRLVGYIWDQEAGHWPGRSMLRSIYRDWVIKDRLLRVDAVKHERNGMGIPKMTITSPDVGHTAKAQGLAQAARLRTGDTASLQMPFGTDMELMGVTGTLPDTLASIRARDEAMAARFLAMFMQLGKTTTGSRALGSEFIDFFSLALDSVADWVCDVTNEHVIEDWVDWNYGTSEELVPLIVSERDEHEELTVTDLVALIGSGALSVDQELEQWARERWEIPQRTSTLPPRQLPAPTPPTPAASKNDSKNRSISGAVERQVTLPERTVRRQPLPFEVRAAIDFAGIELTFTGALQTLLADWQQVRQDQIDDLVLQIAATQPDALQTLAEIQAAPRGAELLYERMQHMASEGIASAMEEAQHQGVALAMPDEELLRTQLESRALAAEALLARSISEAAARRAVSVAGTSLAPTEVATEVRGYLEGLKDGYLEDQFRGLLTQGQNTGRREAIATRIADVKQIMASELLDSNTCDACLEIDGTEYGSLEEAEADYPTGGYAECYGGPRCRGLLVAVYADEATPTLDVPGA